MLALCDLVARSSERGGEKNHEKDLFLHEKRPRENSYSRPIGYFSYTNCFGELRSVFLAGEWKPLGR
jgi:hypothetical protein